MWYVVGKLKCESLEDAYQEAVEQDVPYIELAYGFCDVETITLEEAAKRIENSEDLQNGATQ
jgi:hypothetical protein